MRLVLLDVKLELIASMQTAELRTTGRKEGSYCKLLRMCMILIKTLVFLRIINEISACGAN